jgi:hypothetical protein
VRERYAGESAERPAHPEEAWTNRLNVAAHSVHAGAWSGCMNERKYPFPR